MPQLLDPNFDRSVVLLLEHADEGSIGLVLNQTVPASVKKISTSLGLRWDGDVEQRIRLGGPVEPMRGWVLHDQPAWDAHASCLGGALWLTSSLDAVRKRDDPGFGGKGARFMFLLGYAGWGAGQLETEMAAGSWVSVPVDELTRESGPGVSIDWIFATQPSQMWEQALRSIGVDPARLVGLHASGSLLH